MIQEKRQGQWLLSDLTEAGLKTYNLDLQGYKSEEPEYTKERTAVQKLRKWVLQTVAPDYKSDCCLPGIPLWQWYSNLQQRCGLSRADDQSQTRVLYKKALKPPRNLKRNPAWIDKWETAMSRATQQGIAEARQRIAWVPDLLQAIQGVMPTWTTTFRQTREREVANGSLKFREVGNLLRKELQALGIQHKPAKATRGA